MGDEIRNMDDRELVAFFHFISWTHLSLGVHVSLQQPNIEVHLPFGFIRIGVERLVVVTPRTFELRWKMVDRKIKFEATMR